MMVAMSWTELVGNALCLDFANTVDRRPDPQRDRLDEPGGVRRWAAHAGLPGHGRAVDVDAGPSLLAARELRDAVLRTFGAVAAGKQPRAADLAAIGTCAAEGLGEARLRPVHGRDGDAAHGPAGGTSYRLEWPRPATGRQVLWAVADSAVELLRHGPLERVGQCPSCTWLFLDTSRNGRRRWCSMAMCGNQVKSARHYARTMRS
jgi:predicted RNA-binding Zn ribbon-like protein